MYFLHYMNYKFSLTIFLFFSLFLFLASAFAEDMEKEKPLLFSADHKKLEWGPCPDIFPKDCEIAVLHGDPAEKNTDIFFKVPPKTNLAKHRHTSAERMVLISGELHVKYDGSDEIIMKPGEYAYGPPELPHDAFCAAGDPCILFIGFNHPIDVFPVEDTKDD